MFAVYLTHPQVEIDPARPVPEWGLSDIGRRRVEALRPAPWVARIGRIFASGETKAIETAGIIAVGDLARVEVDERMGENDRSATGFLPPPQFEAAADEFFAHPAESFRGWELAIDAQNRIVGRVDAALLRHDPAIPVLFVGHGAVGTLLKCHLGSLPIARSEDQPAGGGNLFAFELETRRLLCDWTPMELWQGHP
jgi:broad specificity phosphatase PhoE